MLLGFDYCFPILIVIEVEVYISEESEEEVTVLQIGRQQGRGQLQE